jgi:hypothetical protein
MRNDDDGHDEKRMEPEGSAGDHPELVCDHAAINHDFRALTATLCESSSKSVLLSGFGGGQRELPPRLRFSLSEDSR